MKVLIISHNPVTNQSNMGKTFISLFSRFRSEELCQLYIYPTLPNSRHCGAHYRITDKQVLKALPLLKHPGGPVRPDQIREDQKAYEDAGDESLYRSRKNKSALRRLGRDALWLLSRWYSPELKSWLEEQAPECIFVAPGVAKFIHNFALRIAKERNIPIVTYVCDEYYFVKEPDSRLDRLRLWLLRRKIEKLMAHTSHLVAISDELRRDYGATFGVPVTKLMTGAAFPAASAPGGSQNPKTIRYFGNIRCNRFVPLGEIGMELDAINGELGTDYRLEIYTAEKDPQILDSLRRHASVRVCPFVSGGAFFETLQTSELLLHVEAFDEASVDYVKNSISTKIADSLASGIPFLAYGPDSIASMKHLMSTGSAITAVSRQALRGMLLTAFTDADVRNRVVERALETAREHHDSSRTSEALRQILREAVESR